MAVHSVFRDADTNCMRLGRPALLMWRALLVLGLAGTAAYAAAPLSEAGETRVFVAVAALAATAAAAGARRAVGPDRRAWLWTSGALGGFVAGALVASEFPTAKVGPLGPSADLVLLLSCVPLALAAGLLGSSGDNERRRSALLDALILSAVAAVVVWDLIVAPLLASASLGAGMKAVGTAHPLVDVVLGGLVVRLLLSRPTRDRRLLFFSTGAALLALANLVFSGLKVTGSFAPGHPVGALWLGGYLLAGFAAVQPAPEQQVQRSGTVIGRVRLAIVLLAVFVPELVLARDLVRRDLIGLNTLTVAVFVSTLVIAIGAFRLLRSLEARLSALILHSTDAIFLVDKFGRIAYASPSAARLWGRKAKALDGLSVLDAFVDEHRQAAARQLGNLLAMPRGATVPLEGRIRAEGGQIRVVEGVGQNLLEDENVRAIVVTMRDTTSRRELEQQLERRAFHDDLTGLANRALFVDRLEHALSRVSRDGDPKIAVLFIDLDDFKAVNDGMGHAAGDALIRGVADRIRSCVRPADTVARLGGDEFTVLVEDIPSVSHVTSLALRLLEVLQLPIEVNGVSLAVPASVGVSFAAIDSTAESLLRDADIAMYSAKSQGKGRVTMFDETLRDVAVQRLALKVELPEALRAAQFSLAYQPIMDVRSADLRGFEALIRWRHPERGLVSPAEFIPAAEETGVIVEIGRWVLEQACHQAVLWNRKWLDPLSISVNVSGVQLHQPGFTDDLQQILDSSGLDPSLLTLELTESVLVRHQRVEAILSGLRALGIGIAIDDFGTGYSSLAYLQHFPVTSLKVDRSFVADLTSRREIGLVRSILSIGDAFGLTTVAEGVETSEQLELLGELGCERAQGYFFGRPQSPGEIDGMLEVTRMARTNQWKLANKVA
jgi:diguanylate cyclase (GGDEF)-like protein/PAS domain S-box-containing protein